MFSSLPQQRHWYKNLQCCAFCKYFYFPDTNEVSGFYCRLLENRMMKITHSYKNWGCVYFRFSLLNFLFGV
jgi:hypothetical protein